MLQLDRAGDPAAGDEVLVGVSGRTNVQLRLRGPTELLTARGPRIVRSVRLWADDPRDLAAAVRQRSIRTTPS